MNISDTMQSIRWLLEKHLGKYESSSDVPISPASITERRESRKLAKVDSTLAIEAIRRHGLGQSIKGIAIDLGSNEMTIGNIIHRRKGYATLPKSIPLIRKWFKERNRE